MIRVVLLAPIDNSLYARLVAFQLRQEREVQLAGIVVRSTLNLKRALNEYRRDGARLLRKFVEKGVRGDKRFAGSAGENLAQLAERRELPFRSLRKLAAEYNIPYQVVSDHNNKRSRAFLETIDPDLVVFTGGGLIKPEVLSIPRIGILNCHTGILPKFRGMDVVEWTAAEGLVNEIGFGVTLHLMDQGVDTGAIIKRERIEFENLRGFEPIRENLEVRMVNLMVEGVRAFVNHTATPRLQKKEEGRQYFVMHPRIREYAKLMLLKQSKAH